jgi:hypothetical protein
VPYSQCVNGRFVGTNHLHLQVENQPSSQLHAGFLFCWLSTLKIEMIHSSETSVHIRTTGAVSHKMATIIATAAKTSNRTRIIVVLISYLVTSAGGGEDFLHTTPRWHNPWRSGSMAFGLSLEQLFPPEGGVVSSLRRRSRLSARISPGCSRGNHWPSFVKLLVVELSSVSWTSGPNISLSNVVLHTISLLHKHTKQQTKL